MVRLDHLTELMALAERVPGRLCYDVQATEEELQRRPGVSAHVYADGTARSYIERTYGKVHVRAWGPVRAATAQERAQMQLHLVDAAVTKEGRCQ
jgi:hypothetical protein